MWILINLILICAGAWIIGYAFKIDSPENYKVWRYFFGGGAIFSIGVISSLIKWWL